MEVALGLPEAWERGRRDPGFRNAERWQYGPFELVFDTAHLLKAVFCEQVDAWDRAASFRVDPGLLDGGSSLTLDAVARSLHSAEIPGWVWRQRHTGAGVLTTEGGASLHFHGPDGALPEPGWTLAALVVDGRAVPEEKLLDASWSPPWASVDALR